MNLCTSKNNSVTDPDVECLLALWNSPVEHVGIAINPIDNYIVFTIVVEAPECPKLEFPIHPLLGGHA